MNVDQRLSPQILDLARVAGDDAAQGASAARVDAVSSTAPGGQDDLRSAGGDDVDGPLVAQAAAGRRVAFDRLVERYQEPIYRFAMRFFGDSEDAMDATQEVFIRAWRGIRSFQGRSRFKTWLYRIAANAFISIRQERKREQSSFLDFLSDWFTRPAGNDPHMAVERAELLEVIQEKLAKLPEEYRIAVILRDFEDHRYDEIAEILEIGEGTVKSRINRGRRQLQEMLSGYLGK